MKKFPSLIISFSIVVIDASAQNTALAKSTISGYLRDKSSGEMMGNVVVNAPISGVRTTTNNYGVVAQFHTFSSSVKYSKVERPLRDFKRMRASQVPCRNNLASPRIHLSKAILRSWS